MQQLSMERLVNRSLLTILATLLLAAVVAPDFARADDEVVERVVVRNRKYRTWNKFEINPTIGFSLVNEMTEQTNFQLGLAYNFSEEWAVELRPGFALSDLTSVALQTREGLASKMEGTEIDDFRNLWRLEWQALAMPRWTPIYGKINLATELPIHFQAYLTAGGGAVGLTRESVAYCQGGVSCEYLSESKATWAGAVGGGLRVFLTESVLLRLELFDVFYPDEYRTHISTEVAKSETPGSAPTAGKVENGITNVLMFNLGASVVF